MRILVLDNIPKRLAGIVRALDAVQGAVVEAKHSIEREQFECAGGDGDYDLLIVHDGNDEAVLIEDEVWRRGRAALVVFSGGFAADKDRVGDVLYVSASYLLRHVSEVVEEGVS